MSGAIDVGYPVFCVAKAHQENAVYVAGGGGSSKTGVPNAVCIIKNVGDKREIVQKEEFNDVVSLIKFEENSKKYIGACVGKEIKLFDTKFRELKSYDTNSENPLSRSIDFSSNGKKLLVIDADNAMHLLTVPGLRVIAKTEPFVNEKSKQPLMTRAAFIRIPKIPRKVELVEEEDEADGDSKQQYEDAICIANSQSLKLCLPNDELTEIFVKKNYGIEPRALYCKNGFVVVAGTRFSDRKSVIIKYKYHEMKLIPVQMKEIPQKEGNTTSLAAGEKTFAIATSEGCIHVFDQVSLRTVAKHQKVHFAPITTLCECGEYYVTGSLDRFTQSVSNKKQRNVTALIFVFLLLITLTILAVYFYVPGGKEYFFRLKEYLFILKERVETLIQQYTNNHEPQATPTPEPTPEVIQETPNSQEFTPTDEI